jgi:rhodanese-related sulfurtransferase
MEISKITAEEVKKLMDEGKEVNFIDVRNPRTWGDSDAKLPGAMRIPTKRVRDNLDKVPRDQIHVIY